MEISQKELEYKLEKYRVTPLRSETTTNTLNSPVPVTEQTICIISNNSLFENCNIL